MRSLISARPRATTSATSKVVIALSGFLGRPEDWDLIPDLVPDGWSLLTIDLWAKPPVDYAAFADDLAKEIKEQTPDAKVRVLLGYSLGGRLALHALTTHTDLFDGAIIVSANPGLPSQRERDIRLQADAKWAERFRQDDWQTLMSDWNNQAALKTSNASASAPHQAPALTRNEADFDRSALAASLEVWSLGAQADLRAKIQQLARPIVFVTGELDSKFTVLASSLAHERLHEHVVVERAGHRVPWDAPSQFRSVLAKYLLRW